MSGGEMSYIRVGLPSTTTYLVVLVLGMTLNCIHIFIVTGSFLYTDVTWGRPVSVSSYTLVFIYESGSYLI